jgi:hypothetical protein
MHVVLSAPEFDPLGYVEIATASNTSTGESRRRVNRIATLDGGSVLNDFGFTESDRTIRLAWTPETPAFDANVVRMLQIYPELHVALRDGVFSAAPETFSPGSASSPESTLTLLITRKISG